MNDRGVVLTQKNYKHKLKYLPIGFALTLGAGLGAAFNSVGIGVALGILSGAVINIFRSYKDKKVIHKY